MVGVVDEAAGREGVSGGMCWLVRRSLMEEFERWALHRRLMDRIVVVKDLIAAFWSGRGRQLVEQKLLPLWILWLMLVGWNIE